MASLFVNEAILLWTLEVEVADFSLHDKNCVYGYPAACTKPKRLNQVCSLEFLCSVYISSTSFFLGSQHLVKINLPKFCFTELLHHTAILKNLNFCDNSARSKTWSRITISWTEMKILLTKSSLACFVFKSHFIKKDCGCLIFYD